MRNMDFKPRVIPAPQNLYDLTVEDVASMFHCGALGIGMSQALFDEKVQECIDANYNYKAFNVEIPFAKQAVDCLGDKIRVMCPIGYPMGNATFQKKLRDVDEIIEYGVGETCISLDYSAMLSGNYRLLEREIREIQQRFEKDIDIIHILPTTLLTDKEILACCEAIKNGGGRRIKANPGYGLGINFEEIALIKRVYGNYFDVHASGGIRRYEDFEHYVQLGCNNIHTQRSVDFLEEFKRRKKERGGYGC